MVIRNVLVTGCDFGLGLEFANVLSHDENIKRIFAGYINLDKAQDLKNLSQENPKVKLIKLPVDNDECIQKAKEFVENQLDGDGLDLLINNAGVNEFDGWLQRQPSREIFLRHYNINILGPVVLTSALLPSLRTAAKNNQNSFVVNISSDRGSVKVAKTWQDDGNRPTMAYGQSKAALNHFTRSLAYYETKNGIITVSVHPGWILTQMGGPEAPATATHAAAQIIKLASKLTPDDSGRYMNRDGEDMEF